MNPLSIRANRPSALSHRAPIRVALCTVGAVLCATVGAARAPGPAGPEDPCAALRTVAQKATAQITPKLLADPALAVRAARIALLEREIRIMATVGKRLPELAADPRIDPALLLGRVKLHEEGLKKFTDRLDRELKAASAAGHPELELQAASSAGHPELLQEGVAQQIVANAYWRRIAAGLTPHIQACAAAGGDATRQEVARAALGELVVSMSHGAPVQGEIRNLLGVEEETRLRMHPDQ